MRKIYTIEITTSGIFNGSEIEPIKINNNEEDESYMYKIFDIKDEAFWFYTMLKDFSTSDNTVVKLYINDIDENDIITNSVIISEDKLLSDSNDDSKIS